jgi:hypothetical protein
MSQNRDEQALKLREGAAVWREIDGEVVLLAIRSSKYLGLNRTAAVLWPAMTAGTNRGELVTLLTTKYDVAVERAESDVDTFISMCREHRLLG